MLIYIHFISSITEHLGILSDMIQPFCILEQRILHNGHEYMGAGVIQGYK